MAWSPKDERRLREMHAAGVSLKLMADSLEKPRSTVWSKLKSLDLAQLDDSEVDLQSLQLKMSQLQHSVSVLTRENKHLTRQMGNWEALCGEVARQASALPVAKPCNVYHKPSLDEQEMVALLSDTHATEQWKSEQTDGFTEYNFETFCRFLWYYGQEIIRFANEDRSKYGLNVLHVDMLGDIFHGVLRVEDEVTNDFATIPGVIATAHVIWQWLQMLAPHFSRIECRCMAGNHGRLHRKPQSRRYVEENRDTLIYLMLKEFATVSGTQHITFRIPKSRVATFRRLGHRVKMGHGDHIKGGNSIAGLPIYGLSREMLRQFRKEVRRAGDQGLALIQYGHWHHYNFLENTLIINGAMAPTDPFAFDELGAITEPTQLIYYTSKRHAIGWRVPLSFKHAPAKHGFTYEETFLPC